MGHPIGCVHVKASKLKIRKGHEINAIDRFMVKFAISDKEYDGTPCWEWTAAEAPPYGYGRFWLGRRYECAYRWAYEYFIGPIPEGLVTDHLCNNPRCVNALHLKATTQKENVLRGNGISASNARKTHCKHGHAFDQQNTWISSKGERHCKTCNNIRMTRYYHES